LRESNVEFGRIQLPTKFRQSGFETQLNGG